MKVSSTGSSFGFCPGKATWDLDTRQVYELLILSCETNQLLYKGGIADQPAWFIDLLSWFAPRYDQQKFYSRAAAIFGDGKKSKGNDSGSNSRRTKH